MRHKQDGRAPIYKLEMRRCSKPGCTHCRDGGKGHGPYWYAYWRDGDKLRAHYVGRELPAHAVLSQTCAGPLLEAVPPLRVCTLGSFHVLRGGVPVGAVEWHRPKVRSLFALLVTATPPGIQRDALLDILWPDLDPGRAARNLRKTLSLLRHALSDEGGERSYIYVQDELLVLRPAPRGKPAPDWLDAQVFSKAAREALASRDPALSRAALAVYAGDYLVGEDAGSRLDEWREALRSQYLSLLAHHADLCASQVELQEAEATLARLLRENPLHEEAARNLMELLGQSGRRAEALHVYQRLALALREELGVGPAAETRLVARQLQQTSAMLPAETLPQPAADRPGNLPISLSAFIGRDRERLEIDGLLRAHRLVTLTGIGGIGKTRLALRVGFDVQARYPDGVWQVEFAGLPPQRDEAGAEILAQVVVRALGAQLPETGTVIDSLISVLQHRRMLLIFDNCEHLIAPAATLIGRLLGSCPDVALLATSRAPFEVIGEAVLQVPPLDLPPLGAALEEARGSEAVELLVTRGASVCTGFALTADNVDTLVAICHRLDGIPFALELAATRFGVFTPREIAARLHDRFRLLITRNPMALPRQRTLQATMDWSYALLEEDERVLLRRLAVFAGGWTLQAAEDICGDSEASEADTVERPLMNTLSGLACKSLVQHESEPGPDGETRFRLLETVRDYARMHLQQAGEERVIAQRHLQWYLRQTECADPELRGQEQALWLDRLERNHDNIRAALAWGQSHSDEGGLALRLAAALWQFWYMRRYLQEGRTWFASLLAANPTAPDAVSAKALNGAGCLAMLQQQFELARTLLKQSVVKAKRAGDQRAIARALTNLGNTDITTGNLAGALAPLREAMPIFQSLGDVPNHASVLLSLGVLAKELSNYEQARAYTRAAVDLFVQLGYPLGQALALENEARVAYLQGACEEAIGIAEKGLVLSREVKYQRSCIAFHQVIAEASAARGDTAYALSHFEEAFRIATVEDIPDAQIDLTHALIIVLLRDGRPACVEHGFLLHGRLQAERERRGLPCSPAEATILSALMEKESERTSSEMVERLAAQGHAAPVEEAFSTFDRAKQLLLGSTV